MLQHVVWKEDKHFIAQCLSVDISSFGKTKKEALKNLQEALELYFEDKPLHKIPRISAPEILSQEFQCV